MRIVSILLIIFIFFSTVTIVNSIEVNNGYYVVKQGDTLASVADKFGVTEEKILTWNNLSGESMVYPGRALKIAENTDTYKPKVERASDKVSINFVDTDIRDILSVVAEEIDKDVLFIGTPIRISIRAASVAKADLIDLIVSTAGEMAWVYSDDLIIVGQKEKINSDFIYKMMFTGIKLKYITSPELEVKAKSLGINLTFVTLPRALKKVWVQGTPTEISRIYKLLETLDRKENFPEMEKKTERSTFLNQYELKFVNAGFVMNTIKALSLPVSFGNNLDNPMYIQVAGPSSELSKFEVILAQIDVEKNTQSPDTGDMIGITKYVLKYISYADAENLLTYSKLGITVMDINSFPKTIFFFGPKVYRDEAIKLLKSVDNKGVIAKEIVDFANSRSKLTARRNLICEITGFPADNFVISEDIERSDGSTKFILYYTGIEADIALIRYVIKQIDNPLGGS